MPVRRISFNTPPSYGLVTRPESVNPSLWNRLAMLLAPSRGPTGKVLRDVSGFAHSGVLTGMDINDWVQPGPSNNEWALDFDEVNDHVFVSDFTYGPKFTLAFWYKLTDNVGSDFQYVFNHGNFVEAGPWSALSSISVFFGEVSSAIPNQLRTNFRDNTDSATNLDAGTGVTVGWHHYECTVGNSGVTMYVDGISRANNT